MPDPSLLADLDKASPAEAVEVLKQVLAVYEARKAVDPLDFFQYKSAGQREFASNRSFGRIALCGNRGGKSHIGGVEVARFVLNKHPHRPVPINGKVWVGCPSEKVQKAVQQKKVMAYIPESRIAHISQTGDEVYDTVYLICNRCNVKPMHKRGSKKQQWICPSCRDEVPFVGFRTYEQAVKIWMGEGLDGIWFDEEPPEAHFKEGLARLMGRPLASWWLTYTPIIGYPWIRERLIERKVKEPPTGEAPRRSIIKWSTYDNKGLSLKEIKDMEEEYPDPEERKLRFHGIYVIQEGLVFGTWDPAANEVDSLPAAFYELDPNTNRPRLRQDLEIWAGIDTGDKFACVFVLIDYEGNPWAIDEVYSVGEDTFARSEDIKEVLKLWGIKKVHYLLDPTSQFQVELSKYGIYCIKPSHQWARARDATLTAINSAQKPERKQPALRVLRSGCPELLKQRMVYRKLPPKQTGPLAGESIDKPLKRYDHCIDALMLVLERHSLASKKTPADESTLTPIQRIQQQVRDAIRRRKDEREGYAPEEEDF